MLVRAMTDTFVDMPAQLDHPLRMARLQAGVGQQELARAVGMNRSSIAAIEEGRTSRPTSGTVERIERALHLPAGQLWRDLADYAREQAEAGPILTPRARAVLAMTPEEVSRYSSFVAWRREIAPSPTSFASMLGLNRAAVAKYEQGIRHRGLPDTLGHALLTVLGISPAYLVALSRLEPSEDEL